MTTGGYAKIFRRLMEWEYYHDSRMVHLLVHCILRANHEDGTWQGRAIPRGSFVTSRLKLAAETGLSEQQIRTALGKMKSTNVIAIKATKAFTMISICKYDAYQSGEDTANQRNNQPSNQPDNQPDNHKQEEKKRRSITSTLKGTSVGADPDFALESPDSQASKASPGCPYQRIAELWNAVCGDCLPRISAPEQWAPALKSAVRQRWQAAGRSLGAVEAIFRDVAASDFLSGRSGKWPGCTFQWATKAGNWQKIAEGQYRNDRFKRPSKGKATEKVDGYF